MNSIFHPSSERGFADHGWLKATHSFSFANYYDQQKIHFGKLRVLNDDIIAPAKGFDIHPHNDMEIITIPLSGSLRHGDNMGNEEIIKPGEVQVMSAGTGIFHSEHNASNSEELKLFQLWIFPDEKGHEPRYDQKFFPTEDSQGKWQLLVSPDSRDGSLVIHQNAFISFVESEKGELNYDLKNRLNGIYFMLVEGEVIISGNKLQKRDALGLWNLHEDPLIEFNEKSKLLAIEVPMN